MSDPRLIHIELDQASILWRKDEIEQERRIAIFDLLEGNRFAPQRQHSDHYAGPYRLTLSSQDGRLVFDIFREDGSHLESLILAMGRFKRPIRDYWAICDSYFQAAPGGNPHHIETIDMARRGVHNQAAELLIERLSGKIDVDFDTARRLFTLICVLHVRV